MNANYLAILAQCERLDGLAQIIGKDTKLSGIALILNDISEDIGAAAELLAENRKNIPFQH